MKRKRFSFCSAVSLLLCVAVSVMWVRSYFAADAIEIYGRHAEGDALSVQVVESFEGRITLWFHEWERGGPAGTEFRRLVGSKSYVDLDPSDVPLRIAGSEWIFYEHGDAARRGWALRIPHWSIVLLLALMVAVLLRYRRGGLSHDLCPTCGYDLRATPDRCPECGTAASVV